MSVHFQPGNPHIAVWDFHEVCLCANAPIEDPFGMSEVVGVCGETTVDGFCDAQDGSVFRVRLLATGPGAHPYTVRFGDQIFRGNFTAVDKGRCGLLQTEGWGWKWGGNGAPFFWNATTAYLMAGLRDDVMFDAIDRLARKGVNRIRVALSPSRQPDGGRWWEPQVTPREDFTFCYSPWLCEQPDVWDDPKPDVTRFDVAYWQKFERLLARAAQYGMIVQVIFFVDAQEPQNYPFQRPAPKPDGASDFDPTSCADDPDERRYFAYAAARFAAFSNVEWCVTNEWALFQSNAWVDAMGAVLSQKDPYGHLCSVHGHGHFPFRTSPWCTHALFQSWDEHGAYDFMLRQRAEQAATGRIIPQVNEEYGYEDHYPGPWGGGRTPPARRAESRRRLAWEITMAGGWQTTGESAESGAGGWINGVGDKDALLSGHTDLIAFFGGVGDWQTLEPVGDYTLANSARRVIYDPLSGTARVERKS